MSSSHNELASAIRQSLHAAGVPMDKVARLDGSIYALAEAAAGEEKSSAERRRAEIGAIVEALAALELSLQPFEERLRRGAAFEPDYRYGLYFARQLMAHVVQLQGLAIDAEAIKEREHRQRLRDWELQRAIRKANERGDG